MDTGPPARVAKWDLSMRSVTLPAGCGEKALETLLKGSTGLQALTVEDPPHTGRWARRLPQTLRYLEITGLEAPLEDVMAGAGPFGIVSLSLRACGGVTDRTLASLPDLMPGLERLSLADCPGVTADGLQKLERLTSLMELTLNHAPTGGLKHLAGLTQLKVLALDEVPDDSLQYLSSLTNLETLILHGVPTTGLNHLSSLAQLRELTLHGVSARGLRKLDLAKFAKLECLTLHGAVSDAMLESVHGCVALLWLSLGDPELRCQRLSEVAVTAEAVSRLAVACRRLENLYLHTTAADSQAVLDALVRTDLGSGSDGRPRTFSFCVPDSVHSQLRRPPSDSRVILWPM